MLYFSNDYSQGAHPEILKRLIETNMVSADGYGEDIFCVRAKEKIREAISNPDAEIFFLVGGTQTNMVVINSMLQKHQGVISADSGHIAIHEAGAIEFTGNKVLPIRHVDGKITSNDLKDYLETFYSDENHSHMVYPGMVYISFPTEYGTIYYKEELFSLHNVCKKYRIPLYIDGARLGYGIMAQDSDMTLKDIADNCDVFYIGATKVGALCGEAVVFTKNNVPVCFTTLIKKHGALLSKGRLLGVQFEALFTADLYLKISKKAIEMAEGLRKGLKEKGYRFFIENKTNQIFIIIDNEKLKKLQEKAVVSFWEKYDENHTVIRLATCWATEKEDVSKLLEIM
ncbi:MAG: threonine aldolase family protein [Erysipelotrichaceae bacterium]|jgi:threonine aldolase